MTNIFASPASFLAFQQASMLDEPAGAFARTMPRSANSSGTLAMATSAQAYIRSIIMPQGGVLNSLVFQVNAAVVGGSHDWAGLLDSTGKVVAMSADGNGNLWTPAVTRIVVPMSAPTPIPQTALYYVVVCSVFITTAPTIDGAAATGAGVAGVGSPANTPVFCGTIGGATQAGPPAIGTALGAPAALGSSNFYAAAI